MNSVSCGLNLSLTVTTFLTQVCLSLKKGKYEFIIGLFSETLKKKNHFNGL